jgi:hypothetical protein
MKILFCNIPLTPSKLSEQQSDYYNLQLQKKNKASLYVYQQGLKRVNKILNLQSALVL